MNLRLRGEGVTGTGLDGICVGKLPDAGSRTGVVMGTSALPGHQVCQCCVQNATRA
jgi:hypothetical protein